MPRILLALTIAVCACDSGQCPDATPITTTDGATSAVTTTIEPEPEPEPATVGDGCSAYSQCPGLVLVGGEESSLMCLLPWSYCTVFCNVDADCAAFDVIDGGALESFTCEDFPGGISMCFRTVTPI